MQVAVPGGPGVIESRFASEAALFAIIALKDDRRENTVVSDTAFKIDGLSPEERLDLLERLWDSLARTPADVPVTPEQRAELDRRLDDLDRDIQEGGELGVPWDEVQRGHEPVKALELKTLNDSPGFINVRLAGYACC